MRDTGKYVHVALSAALLFVFVLVLINTNNRAADKANMYYYPRTD